MGKDINLHHLFIQIPTQFKEGLAVAYISKSIGEILDSEDFYELVHLQEWISDQIMAHIGWHMKEPITTEVIANALKMFDTLGIKPEGCTYAENYLGADDEVDEQP